MYMVGRYGATWRPRNFPVCLVYDRSTTPMVVVVGCEGVIVSRKVDVSRLRSYRGQFCGFFLAVGRTVYLPSRR